MLQILQTENISRYSEYCGEQSGDIHAVEAVDKDEILGFCVYHFDEDSVYIDFIDCNEAELFDGLIRSVLYIANGKNYKNAVFNIDDEKSINMMKQLNYPQNKIFLIEQWFLMLKKCK